MNDAANNTPAAVEPAPAPAVQLPNVSEMLKNSTAKVVETENCANCHFMRSKLAGTAIAMECRREAPKCFLMAGRKPGEVATVGAFPQTDKTQWCGEWSPKTAR